MVSSVVFKDFGEYWHYTSNLSREQRKMLYDSLSEDQKKCLQESYVDDKWSDLLYRNQINDIIDELKQEFGYDILDVKIKAFKGKKVYVPVKFWDALTQELGKIKRSNSGHTDFVIGGLSAESCANNDAVVLIVADMYKHK